MATRRTPWPVASPCMLFKLCLVRHGPMYSFPGHSKGQISGSFQRAYCQHQWLLYNPESCSYALSTGLDLIPGGKEGSIFLRYSLSPRSNECSLYISFLCSLEAIFISYYSIPSYFNLQVQLIILYLKLSLLKLLFLSLFIRPWLIHYLFLWLFIYLEN